MAKYFMDMYSILVINVIPNTTPNIFYKDIFCGIGLFLFSIKDAKLDCEFDQFYFDIHMWRDRIILHKKLLQWNLLTMELFKKAT